MRTPSTDKAAAFVAGADFVWHQRFEVAPGIFTPGVSDVAWLIDNAQLPADLQGMSVLDVGTTNGGLAFAAERRGADKVVAVDIESPEWYGFDAAASLLESRVEYRRTSVYELATALDEQFDLVLFFGVLYHLRHPLLALDNIRAVTGGEMVLETALGDAGISGCRGSPVARFYRRDELNGDGSNWFAPSLTCLTDWCESCGFETEVLTTVQDPPVRAVLRGRVTPGEPEWIQLSYERPVRASVLTSATAVADSPLATSDGRRAKHDREEKSMPQLHAPQWDLATVPWLDRYYAEIDAYVASLSELPEGYDLREKLLAWAQFGYVKLEGVIESDTVDHYVHDLEEFLDNRGRYARLFNIQGRGEVPAHAVTDEDLANPHLRVMDFHSTSLAGKELMLDPAIVSFLEHVFHDTVVAMQSLTFLKGTEQPVHQDFAFVVPVIPSHLAGAWIALEDVHPDAGPLGYYSGSHTIRKFDWGNGLHLTDESTAREGEFAEHIEAQNAGRGIEQDVVLARKGDVFIWHGALAHLGTHVKDAARTRRSFVVHYSSLTGYPRDRRRPSEEPQRHELNGGIVYGDPVRADEENALNVRRSGRRSNGRRDPSEYADAIRGLRHVGTGPSPQEPALAHARSRGAAEELSAVRAELAQAHGALATLQNSKLMRFSAPARAAWYEIKKMRNETG